MNSSSKYNFQYCQKIVVFSKDLNSVLLCKRKDEDDFNEIYTFIGGKMETSDKDIISAIQREKDEEVGENFKAELYPKFSNNVNYIKKNGDFMILPHYYARHIGGEIKLNEEYSGYKWVNISDLDTFEPKIKNIPETVRILLGLKTIMKDEDLTII